MGKFATVLVCSLLCSTAVFAQQKAVQGMVFDAQREPIIGATVKEKGTNNATVTDLDGAFTLNVKPGTTLVVSYLGFQPQEVTVGSGGGQTDSHAD